MAADTKDAAAAPRSRRGLVIGSLVVAVVVAGSWLERRSDVGALVSVVAQFGMNLALSILAVKAANRAVGRQRIAWMLTAFGPTLAVVLIPVLVADALRGGDHFSSAAILGPFLAAATIASVAGLVLLSPPQVRGSTATRFALDAVIASLSVFFVLWAAFDVRESALGGAPFDSFLTLLYPAADAASAVVVLLVLDLAQWKVPRWYGFVAASALLVFASDTLAAMIDGPAPGLSAVISDSGFLVGLLLLCFAAQQSDPWPRTLHQERFRAQWLPYVPFALAILAAMYDSVEHGRLRLDLVWIALAGVVAVVIRSILLLRDNYNLAEARQKSDAFKTQLLRFISHEMGNPLVPLRLQIGLLQGGPDKGGKWSIVDRSIGRLETLSTDVRLMALAETHRLVQDRTPTDITARSTAAAETYRAIAEQKGITLTPPAGGPVMAPIDPERFDQVLDNFLSNAIKFTPRDGHIEVRVVDGADDVRIEIRDTGAGLTPEQMSSLFAPFARAHGDAAPGLGLGLYLCKSIVQDHGGSIGADSPGAGQGSVFYATFPKQVLGDPRPKQLPAPPRYTDPVPAPALPPRN